jgi:hypothetical protein
MPIVYWRLSLASVSSMCCGLYMRLRLVARRVDGGHEPQYFSASATISSKSSRPVADEDHVARAVALLEVARHLVALELLDRLGGAEDAHRQRVVAEVRLHQLLVEAVAGVVEVHGDLFEDHLLLGREVARADGGAEQVRQVLDRALP